MDPLDYRRIVGQFATGVTVVTTAIDGMLHGMTANAVLSLSLDPLLFLVAVDHEAHAHEQMMRAARFGVNILSEGQEQVSRTFAEKAPPGRGTLRGVDYHLGPYGTPIIDGSLASIECELRDRHAGGDHTIFIGEVLGGDITNDAPPLVFYQARYRRLVALDPAPQA